MNKKSLCVCIDLGSNMCRMLVGSQNADKSIGFNVVKSFSYLIYLGKDPNYIDDKGQERVIKALTKCRQILEELNADVTLNCIATAIFRSAENGEEVLKLIEEKCGFEFRILLPDEEIIMSAYGCMSSFREKYSFIIDMGGGSTEVGLFKKKTQQLQLLKWISLPYGLFYFGQTMNAENKILPIDAHKILLKFGQQTKNILGRNIPIIIARSGVMSSISKQLTKNKVPDQNLYKKLIPVADIKLAIQQTLEMRQDELIKNKITSSRLHIPSIKGSMFFIDKLIDILPVNDVVLSQGGVKEGMMVVAFKQEPAQNVEG